MRKRLLFVLCNLYKDSNFYTNLKEKALKNDFSSSYKTFYILQAVRPTLPGKYYADVTLNTRTAPAAFSPCSFAQSFLLASSFSKSPMIVLEILNTLT